MAILEQKISEFKSRSSRERSGMILRLSATRKSWCKNITTKKTGSLESRMLSPLQEKR